jgi:hypothetical protein
MDTQQIQQQMRVRRAAIDAKLDLLDHTATEVRRRSMPVLIAAVSALSLILMWTRRRATRKALPGRSPRLLPAG